MLPLAQTGTWFPVILHSTPLKYTGHVKITPLDNYSSFMAAIYPLIPIHPSHLKSFLMHMTVPGSLSPMHYQFKAPITPWTDFSLIFQQKDCCFFVCRSPMRASDHQDSNLYNWLANSGTENLIPAIMQSLRNNNADATARRVCKNCGVIVTTEVDEFHCCKFDVIVVNGYRTKFGPIGPWKTIEPKIEEVGGIELEMEREPNGLYSLFGPMPCVESILHELREAFGLGKL